ncbi:MAG: ABA4-like family protein [Pelagibacteraceae bacterium]
MINNFQTYLTYENIYLLANWGVLPFWVLLILAPNNVLTKFIVHSIIAPLLLATAYIYIGYKIYLDGNIFLGFDLYFGLDNLYTVFSEETFLLIFWLHFLSISLFIGAWIARDCQKYMIPKVICVFSLIITYFSGPVGLVFYWFMRIFFAKKISFND